MNVAICSDSVISDSFPKRHPSYTCNIVFQVMEGKTPGKKSSLATFGLSDETKPLFNTKSQALGSP
jgi:hypothetical protein